MPLQCCKDKWPTIPDDEPVFVIRGKDLLAIETVERWIDLAKEAGVNDEKMAAVGQHYIAIFNFQTEHPERCKIPD
jgi:hypothetical protein